MSVIWFRKYVKMFDSSIHRTVETFATPEKSTVSLRGGSAQSAVVSKEVGSNPAWEAAD